VLRYHKDKLPCVFVNFQEPAAAEVCCTVRDAAAIFVFAGVVEKLNVMVAKTVMTAFRLTMMMTKLNDFFRL
jgi:hypothetical protein